MQMAQKDKFNQRDFRVDSQFVNYVQEFSFNDQHQDVGVEQNESDQPNSEIQKLAGPYTTSFVCMVAPRFEEHLLAGDISDDLYKWMKEICISFGWQLKFIEVRSEYMHWVMSVGLATYPMQFMKTILKETSIKVFDNYPKFRQKNISNHFWAPWYFVGVGEAPYSQSSIKEFLKQIRMEQGLY